MASRSINRTKPPKKVAYAKRMNESLDNFKTILVVQADNVRSGQMHDIRAALRGRAEIIMGKNTLMRKVFSLRLDGNATDANQDLYDSFVSSGLLTGNVGLVLTNEKPQAIMDVLAKFKVLSDARAGAISQCTVIIPQGPTGLQPTQTQFFMVLNIPTKIDKGQVTITKDIVVLKEGDRVGSSEAKLLAKMKIKPFLFGLETLFVVQDGTVYPRAVIDMTDEMASTATQAVVDDIAAVSLATGLMTAPAIAHEVFNAFKDILAVAVETGVTFKEFGAETLIENIKSGKAAAAAAPAASAPAAAAAPAPAAKAAAPAKAEEEEAGDFGMDLF